MRAASRARLGQVLAVAVLLALAAAWAVWPSGDGRADLEPDATATSTGPPPTTVRPTTTTVPPEPSVPPADALPAERPSGPAGQLPLRLSIPSLGVDAPVVPVGLEPDRQMEVPPAAEVGWYELGPRPGEGGSAVLAAHVDFAGRPGAFVDLASIAVGAEVVVAGAAGPQRFTVTAREQVAKDEVQLERYFTGEGPPRLTLITCGGAFSRSERHYDDNIIITAQPAA